MTNELAKTIGILTKLFGTYGSNLVILALTGDELWWNTRTDTPTNWQMLGNGNTQMPKVASGKKMTLHTWVFGDKLKYENPSSGFVCGVL